MTERVGYRIISNKNIFYLDYSHIEGEEFTQLIFHTINEIDKITEPTLFLANIENCEIRRDMSGNFNSMGKKIKNKVIKSAIYGVSKKYIPLLNIYFKITGSKAKTFDSYNRAVEYLTKD